MAQRLNQIVAIEKGQKERVNAGINNLYHAGQKADPFNGFVRTYRPMKEDGDKFPTETKLVQTTARDVFVQASKLMTDLFDITATKDYANCGAKADVVVGGKTLIKDAPVTYLLFVEQRLTDIRSIVDKLPTLSPDESWTLDPQTSMFRSSKAVTQKTAKTQEALVLAAATDKHPAQAQLITVDRVVGEWEGIKLSGAMPAPQKAALLEKIETVMKATKFAREQANMIEAPPISVGDNVLSYIFSDVI